MDTCQQCGSWSVAGHNHKKVIELGPICASLHDMDLGPFGNGLAETMYDEGDENYKSYFSDRSTVYCMMNVVQVHSRYSATR